MISLFDHESLITLAGMHDTQIIIYTHRQNLYYINYSAYALAVNKAIKILVFIAWLFVSWHFHNILSLDNLVDNFVGATPEVFHKQEKS